MLKGINRQIIEINDTGNVYFERALLVVRPGFTDMPEPRLNREARDMVRSAGGYSGLRLSRRERRLRRFGYLAAGGIFGGIISAVLMIIFK